MYNAHTYILLLFMNKHFIYAECIYYIIIFQWKPDIYMIYNIIYLFKHAYKYRIQMDTFNNS